MSGPGSGGAGPSGAEGDGAERRRFSGVRVLVVDDEEGHAEAMAETLGALGLEAIVATSGNEGVRAIAEEDPDVVLTDLVMNDCSGMDVLRAARAGRPDQCKLEGFPCASVRKGDIAATTSGAIGVVAL